MKRSIVTQMRLLSFLVFILTVILFAFHIPGWLYNICLFYIIAWVETLCIEGAFRDVFLRRLPKEWIPKGWFVYVLATAIPPAAFASFGMGIYSIVGYVVFYSIIGIIFYYGAIVISIKAAQEIAAWWRRL